MLDQILIAILIFSGIALIIVEIIFIPGTTIVGIFGFLIGAYGVFRSYEVYGNTTGHLVLALSGVFAMVTIVACFKSGAWKKFANQSVLASSVNEHLTETLEKGMQGITISSLKPIGKAEFEGKEYEVSSLGMFVEEAQKITILRMDRNKIYVELLNKN